MGLFSRSAGPAEAVYARSIDGEQLWLAVRGEAPLRLRGPGIELEIPLEPQAGLLTARFPLNAVLNEQAAAHDVELRLVAGPRGNPVAAGPVSTTGPGVETPASLDGRWQLGVASVDGEVVVRRTRREPGVAALAFRVSEEGVTIDLATGSSLTLGIQADLAPGQTTDVQVEGSAVVRARNVMARPHFSVALPPMPEADVELRWLKDGRLAVHRRDGGSA